MPRKSKAILPVASAQKTEPRISNETIAKAMVPRDLDSKYYGAEPSFIEQPSSDSRNGILVRSMNWYQHFFGTKEAKAILVQYLTQNKKLNEAKILGKVPDSDFIPTLGWLARLSMRGLVLTEVEKGKIETEVERLKNTLTQGIQYSQTGGKGIKKEENYTTKRPNVQEIMRDRAQEVAGEIEGMFDGFITEGKPSLEEVNVVSLLTERKIMTQHVPVIINAWKARKEEFEVVQQGKDAQLKEGYSQYTKMGIRNIVKFCDSVIASLNSYIAVKRTIAKPRARKPVSPEKQASKLKYLKAFKDVSLKLDLTSVPPSKIVGATEVWAYDTAKRKLWYLVADQHIGTLSVKGTTVLGIDMVQSGVKTLRKPAEVLKALASAGKPAARKLFKEINAVQAQPKGRTNEGLILLKAY